MLLNYNTLQIEKQTFFLTKTILMMDPFQIFVKL